MESTATRENPYGVRAVQRALDVLDALADAPEGRTLAQLAEAADLPKSSIFRYLATLEARGYVERDGERGRFRIGRRLGTLHSRRLDLVARTARPHLDVLRDRFSETVNLGVLDGNRIAYLQIVESPQAMRFAARQGDSDPLHSTSLGKAIASQLSREHVLRILESEGMPKLTVRTITEPGAFLAELEEIRRRGFAVDNGENEEHGGCVAVAITGVDVPAAISLSAPAARLSPAGIDEIAAALRETAARIADELEPAHA
jgi:IclR family transcriptional regulator, acetate operon repressor